MVPCDFRCKINTYHVRKVYIYIFSRAGLFLQHLNTNNRSIGHMELRNGVITGKSIFSPAVTCPESRTNSFSRWAAVSSNLSLSSLSCTSCCWTSWDLYWSSRRFFLVPSAPLRMPYDRFCCGGGWDDLLKQRKRTVLSRICFDCVLKKKWFLCHPPLASSTLKTRTTFVTIQCSLRPWSWDL